MSACHSSDSSLNVEFTFKSETLNYQTLHYFSKKNHAYIHTRSTHTEEQNKELTRIHKLFAFRLFVIRPRQAVLNGTSVLLASDLGWVSVFALLLARPGVHKRAVLPSHEEAKNIESLIFNRYPARFFERF